MSARERVKCSGVNSNGHDAVGTTGMASRALRFIGMRIMPQGERYAANSGAAARNRAKCTCPALSDRTTCQPDSQSGAPAPLC